MKIFKLNFIISKLSLIFLFLISCNTIWSRFALINVPIADLLAKKELNKHNVPVETKGFKTDLIQISQLLYGEHANILKTEDNWAYIEALDQFALNKDQVIPISGWTLQSNLTKVTQFPSANIIVKSVRANIYSSAEQTSDILFEVSYGTKFLAEFVDYDWYKVYLIDGGYGFIRADDINLIDLKKDQLPNDEKLLRNNIVNQAKQFLGMPYSWGGRSAFFEKLIGIQRTSVDCSSYTNLCFEVNGIRIPRGANQQFLMSRKIYNFNDLKPADLIFFARADKPDFIKHVLMYLGNDEIIHAHGHEPDRKVIIVRGDDFFKKPIEKFNFGARAKWNWKSKSNDVVLYAGSYF